MACTFSAVYANDKKAPAHQVPAESIEEIESTAQPAAGADEPAGNAAAFVDSAADGVQKSADTEPKPNEGAKKSSAEATGSDGTGKDARKSVSGANAAPPAGPKPVTSGATFSDDAKAGKTEAGGAGVQPTVPRRKPPKPVISKAERDKKSLRPDAALKRTDRDKYLCKVLQACRNDFVRCKSKIKHPDQSPEWSAAKEACGAVYKDCVHKDFDGGEWFFTRWFYFQELNCK